MPRRWFAWGREMFGLVMVVVGLSVAAGAAAQPLFGNPLAEANAYRSERGALPEARYRARYEVSTTTDGEVASVAELVMDVATDWSLTREGDRAVLRDFRLNRVFTLEQDGFTTSNGLGVLVFRVMERQNRNFLLDVLNQVGGKASGLDACTVDAELGVQLPGSADEGKTRFRKRDGFFIFECDGRRIGGFEPSDEVAPPPAFWPTLFEEMPTHPALHRRMRESQKLPVRVETRIGIEPEKYHLRTWKLLSIEQVATAYPLVDGMKNGTAKRLDTIVGPGTARLAQEVVDGRAAGGAPTRASWAEHLSSLSLHENDATAAMTIMPTLNMFPGLERQCTQAGEYPVCELMRNLPEIAKTDPAAHALLEVATAEQRGDAQAAIDAMAKAQQSPLRDDPALGASFALAVIRFDEGDLKRARDAGLPTDVVSMQARALHAYPYNPAYWTDIGDRIGAQYEWPDAFLLYDVAFSLPMPEALADSRVLQGKRESIERIRSDFPDAFLPR